MTDTIAAPMAPASALSDKLSRMETGLNEVCDLLFALVLIGETIDADNGCAVSTVAGIAKRRVEELISLRDVVRIALFHPAAVYVEGGAA